MSFIDDVVQQVQEFATANNVATDRVHIRLVVADGSTFMVHGGLIFNEVEQTVMVFASPQKSASALVVRNEHILTAEFQLPGPPATIGLHSELKP